jgi:hypothetical protein
MYEPYLGSVFLKTNANQRESSVLIEGGCGSKGPETMKGFLRLAGIVVIVALLACIVAAVDIRVASESETLVDLVHEVNGTQLSTILANQTKDLPEFVVVKVVYLDCAGKMVVLILICRFGSSLQHGVHLVRS